MGCIKSFCYLWLPCGSVNGNPHWVTLYHIMGFLGSTVVKNPSANAGDARDTGLIPGLGRSPGAGNGYPLHYSCLKNSKDREAWRVTVHRVAKSQTWLSTRRHSQGAGGRSRIQTQIWDVPLTNMLRDRRAQRRNNSELARTGKRLQRGRDPKQDMDKGEALGRKKERKRATKSETLKVELSNLS